MKIGVEVKGLEKFEELGKEISVLTNLLKSKIKEVEELEISVIPTIKSENKVGV